MARSVSGIPRRISSRISDGTHKEWAIRVSAINQPRNPQRDMRADRRFRIRGILPWFDSERNAPNSADPRNVGARQREAVLAKLR